jgi:hypothetical protein
MKTFAYLALLGLANCFDASVDYDVTTDPDTKYMYLTPKAPHTHEETLIFLHGGNMSADTQYNFGLKTEQIAPLTTKIVIANAPVAIAEQKGGKTYYSYVWWRDVPKGTGYTDDLGNDIVAI